MGRWPARAGGALVRNLVAQRAQLLVRRGAERGDQRCEPGTQLEPWHLELVPARVARGDTRELERDSSRPLGVLAVCEAVEIRGRDEPDPRQKMLLDIEQAD